jgi:transposase-like protein
MAGTRARRCKRSPAWNRGWGRQHLEAQAESGLSVHDYCFAYGLEAHTFYNWRRRLNRERPTPTGKDDASRLPAQLVFAEVVLVSPAPVSSESVVEVVLRCGRRLQVGADFDEGALRRLVGLLESLPC